MKKLAQIIVEKRNYIIILYLLAIAASVFGMFQTKVNYDMSQYLPTDSPTKEGMAVMSQEFGDLSGITVMFRGLETKRQNEITSELMQIPHVQSVVYLPNDEAYQKDSCSRYQVTVAADPYSKEAAGVLEEIRETYKGDDISLSGAVCDSGLLVETLEDEIPLIALVAVLIIFAVLFLLCDSWAEPFLFMGCIGIAVLLNMGTNALLPSVSFMTNAVGALLQLGLSMDYSIMLMNRYMQEKKVDPEPKGAMKRALAHSFGAITGSSVTTIAGLLVLVCMSFRIGQDMGIVLAKGVFISLLCIFTLLPGLAVKADPLICRTHKRSFHLNMNGIMKAVTKGRFVLAALILIVTVGAVLLKGDLGISFIKMFENEEQQQIESVFGVENQTVLLYEQNEEPEQVASYIKWLENQENICSVQDYSNTLGKPYTSAALAEEMNLDPAQVQLLYQLYEYQNPSQEKEAAAGDSEQTAITLEQFLTFVTENILTNELYASSMTEEQKKQLQDGQKQLAESKALMAGKRYNRMVITADYPVEGHETFSYIKSIQKKAEQTFGGSYYFIGDSAMGYEMDQGFAKELNFVTILTIVTILVVVLITFRSLIGASMLVVLIQSAVYITTAIVCLQGITVNYIALILVQCILMGATIDYGILLLSNYREARTVNEPRPALLQAMDRSIQTILTSSLILIGSCLTVGLMMSQKIIAQTCSFIACGAFCALLLVLFILPALLLLLDRFLIKKRKENNHA